MNRITMKCLEALIQRINRTAKTPLTYCEVNENKSIKKINIGHYHLDSAYGGWKLVQTDNESGGIRTITHGYISKKELYYQLLAFISGLESKIIN